MGYPLTISVNNERMKKLVELEIDISNSDNVREFILQAIDEKIEREVKK